jgi:P pilus assembly chaperone PapD
MKSKLHLTMAGMFLALLAAALPAQAQPVITIQPTDQIATAGSAATFTLTATGTPPLTYQWRRYTNTTQYADLSGETNATYVRTNAQPTQHRFGAVVTDGSGLSVTSSLARLTVFFLPAIVTEPADQTAAVGDRFTLRVTASGTAPLAYQWYFNGTPHNGATSSNLVFASVQLSNAGAYHVVVTNLYGAATSRVATLTIVQAQFTRIINGPVATNVAAALTAAWGDYDDDGFIDLILGAGFTQPDFLYRNRGDGTFEQIGTGEIATLPSDTTSAVWGDYDNDGHLDLFLSNAFTPSADRLFHNNGNGTFTRITTGSIVNDSVVGLGAAWADYDRDGWIDLFVANSGPRDFLYRNQRDGTFLQITDGPLVSLSANAQSAAWADFDNDGDPDLAVGYLDVSTTDFLYRNDGDGLFTRLPAITSGDDAMWTRGLGWADYDNDGDLDLMVCRDVRANDRLYQNQGDGTFRLVEDSVVSNDGLHSSAPAWGDYDNDGWLDLFVSNHEGDANRLYHNKGDGTFTRVTEGPVATEGGGDIGSFGAAWGDYDNDGSLDLIVANGHPNVDTFSNRRSFLYHNNGSTNAWVMLRLIGTVSNRSAIGAKVRLRATIGGRTFWQMREISGGSGFTSQNDLRAHFGLGDATNIETLRIEWPSGIVQELSAVELNRIHTVTEPLTLKVKATGLGRLEVVGRRDVDYIVEASADLIHWEQMGTMPGAAEFVDFDVSFYDHRFYRVRQTP